MPTPNSQIPRQQTLSGIFSGVGAFLIWGLCPIYWKLISDVPALEIVLHRTIWSFILVFPIILFITHHRIAFINVLRSYRQMSMLLLSSTCVALNWLIYVWAVNNNHMIQASMGYYITPLVNVLLGMLFLGERLRKFQAIAVGLAFTGVFYLTIYYGEFPWIALSLAVSFGLYGLVRKVIEVGSIVGLAIETGMLSIPGVFFWGFLDYSGRAVFLNGPGPIVNLLIIGTGLITIVPLLLFTMAVRQLRLITVGFIQYLGPTCMYLLGIFVYHEHFSAIQATAFVLIWSALAIYSTDMILQNRRNGRAS